MSIEQAKLALEKVKSDKAFADQAMAIENLDERIKFINESGFECTLEEVKAASEELGDADLDNVAGGCFAHCHLCSKKVF
ncbi:Nif11-like leader peptide family natural product precursor [Chlorobium phaeovibrioides]|uniref:Nif11-like leader peptide family natural product n=1 Tax=Chlorobium phaeovibrioides TaxID=1094 RepID=A0A432AX45_CHLPH|nr:Nif11-like leader peptide family natural product precursor [Chlorobium phaeovibrioides]MDT9547770.1 Nif11-like leader peptide family natural product precursor [Chlorobium phaeovibrioides]RTY39977.1 Nif11-like leader peptide family natural product precursor [Chlorobium phaeovibrioides]